MILCVVEARSRELFFVLHHAILTPNWLIHCPQAAKGGVARLNARRCSYPHPVAGAPRPYTKSSQARVLEWSRQLGFCPLSAFAAQETSALTATRRRDCGRRSRPQTRSTSRTIDPPSASVCSRPAPCSRTLRGEAVTANCQLPSARPAFRSLAVPPFLARSSRSLCGCRRGF